MTDTKTAPADLAATLAAVEAALWAADLPRAMGLAADAVGGGASHPTLLGLAGLKRMHAGDNAGALPLLLKAREQTPRHVDLLNALGECLTRLSRPREALEVFDTALAIAPDARLHFGRAMALEDLSELDAARAAFEQALLLNPAFSEALSRLALLAVQRGDAAGAHALAIRALAIDPRDPAVRIALASAALEQKDMDTAERQVSALVQDPDIGPSNRAYALSLAGDILDAQDRTAEAFAAYAASKAVQRDAFAPAMAGLESVRARELRLTDYFQRADAEAWRGSRQAQVKDHTHVFLVGFPRSGTTLLEQVLASHPDVAAMQERTCLMDSAAAFFGSDAGLDRLATLSEAELDLWRGAYWKRVSETEPVLSRPVFVDKMPLNAVFLPLIVKLFPHARILLAVRDPRDVVLSCFRRRFGMNAGMFEFTALETSAAYYAAVMELVQVYSQKLAPELRQIRHESLVADFDGEARRLCDFLGLEFQDGMRAFAGRGRNIDTPSSIQLARGLNDAGVAQWRRYRAQLEPVLSTLAPFVARFGYTEN